MSEETGDTVVELGDGSKLIAPSGGKKEKGLLVARPMNRQQKREMQRRTTGYRGTKAKRHKGRITDAHTAKEVTAAEQKFLAEQKVIEAAQNMRDLTRGGFWLPGDKA